EWIPDSLNRQGAKDAKESYSSADYADRLRWSEPRRHEGHEGSEDSEESPPARKVVKELVTLPRPCGILRHRPIYRVSRERRTKPKDESRKLKVEGGKRPLQPSFFVLQVSYFGSKGICSTRRSGSIFNGAIRRQTP